MPTLHIQLLGGFLLCFDDTPVTTVDFPRLQTLLSYLVLHRNTPQSRRQLAFLLWPDAAEGQARTNLRNLFHRLRNAMPAADAFLYADGQVIQWQLDAPFTVDVADFEHAVATADQTNHRDIMRSALEQAVACYRGDLLPNCYDDWIMPERERLHQVFRTVLNRLIRLLETQREYQTAISYAQRLLRHDSLHESTYRCLMRLHAFNDDRASALQVYHTCAEVLQRELGVPPSQATQALYERLLNLKEHFQEPLGPAIRGNTPLLGRDDEWRQLQAAWEMVIGGQPRLVLILGEAGIGKTRLGQELRAWAGRQGIICAHARCYAAEGGLAYSAITTWLQADTICAALPVIESVWRTEVARLVPDLLAEEPYLPAPIPMTEPWQRQRFFEALARAVLGNGQPRLLVLDDLQWCDQETLEWLHYLLRFDPRAPMLIVGTARPEEIGPDHPLVALLATLRRDERVTEIALRPLDALVTTALAAHVAERGIAVDRATALYRETEGNPLFVVELVRAGFLEQQEQAHDRSHPLSTASESTLPPTVQAVIAARLARLSPPARDLVGLAATIGREFTLRVLEHTADNDDNTLVDRLDELLQQRIMYERAAGTYDFSHGKIREVVYGQLSAARRQLLHRRVAQALERAYGIDSERADAQAGMDTALVNAANSTIDYPALVHHWHQAGSASKTTMYLAKVGGQAPQNGACTDGISLELMHAQIEIQHAEIALAAR